MFCSLEKLKIGMSASLLLGLFLTAHGKGKWIFGRLDSKYLSSMGNFVNWKECRKKICGNDTINCRFAVTASKECYRIYVSLRLLLKWSPEKILTDDENMAIYISYTDRADIMTEKPRVWWLYDNVSKGRNFGTAGPALDIPVGSVVWKKNATGPRDGSPLLYAEGKYEKVALEHKGKLLLDMDKFTISMWVKTEKVTTRMTLLDSIPDFGTCFALYPSFHRNQLALNLNGDEYSYYTKINNTGVDDWRHVAVVYNPGSFPIFFLNGTVWPLLDYYNVRGKRIQPTHLVMWKSVFGWTEFRGRIACVMVFQAALSQSQIEILKDNCP